MIHAIQQIQNPWVQGVAIIAIAWVIVTIVRAIFGSLN